MNDFSIRKYVLYKLDRTLAIVGIIVLGIYALMTKISDCPIAMAALGGLTAYIGSRSGGTREK